MILRFEMSEVRALLVAYLDQRPGTDILPAAVLAAEEAAAREEGPEPSGAESRAPAPAPPSQEDAAPEPQTESAPAMSADVTAAAEHAAGASREKTEQAISALCAEARGEGIICMGLRAHLDPYFIVRTYVEVLGCSDRDARAAFQAYIKKHPQKRLQS